MDKIEAGVLKTEGIYLIALFAAIVIITKIAFSGSSLGEVIKLVGSVYWLWVLPGFMLMYFFGKLGFGERLVLGGIGMLGIYGVGSYYLGILGLNLGISIYALPLLAILAAGFIIYRRLSLNKDVPAHPDKVEKDVQL
ncbi:hypothetical protein JXB11_00725 [Candidatus Woesearchaeota archaeon]|nr:hypothetical protein [Candidatus Woesearchaeota archaeon]